MTVHLCECGCGLPAPISPKTSKHHGWVKGQPKRFISGHNGRRYPVGATYQSKMVSGTRRYLHRLRAEKALGKPLPVGAEVHHVDGTRSADSPLVICQDLAYHKLLHFNARIVKAGGNPQTDRICSRCRRVKPISAFSASPRPYGTQSTCRECFNAWRRSRKLAVSA